MHDIGTQFVHISCLLKCPMGEMKKEEEEEEISTIFTENIPGLELPCIELSFLGLMNKAKHTASKPTATGKLDHRIKIKHHKNV